MEINEILKYKTRVGVGTDEEELKNRTGFDLVSKPIDNVIEDEMEEAVKNSKDYEDAIFDLNNDELYGNIDVDNTTFENKLKGLYFPSEYLRKDLNVTAENYDKSTIFNFSPVVMNCKDKDNNDVTFFINLGPNITIYKADNEDAREMTKVISMKDEYPTPFLNFFVNECDYDIVSDGASEKQVDVDEFVSVDKIDGTLKSFFADIGMVIPVEQTIENIFEDGFVQERFNDVANVNVNELNGENTKFYIDSVEVHYSKDAQKLPITELFSNIDKYRINHEALNKMNEIKKELDSEKVNYNKETFEENYNKIINSNVDFDLSLNTSNEDKIFDIDTYKESSEKEYDDFELSL